MTCRSVAFQAPSIHHHPIKSNQLLVVIEIKIVQPNAVIYFWRIGVANPVNVARLDDSAEVRTLEFDCSPTCGRGDLCRPSGDRTRYRN